MALESISVRLEKEQIRAIETLAARRGTTFAEVFREVVKAHFQSERDERAREESAIVRRLDAHAERLTSVDAALRTLSSLGNELESHQRLLRDDRQLLTHFVGSLQSGAREALDRLTESANRVKTVVRDLDRGVRRHTWKAWAAVLAVSLLAAFGASWGASWLWATRHPYAARTPTELQALYYGVRLQRTLAGKTPADQRRLLQQIGVE